MDMKFEIELGDTALKIGGVFDDNGEMKKFNREFKLTNKKKRGLESDSLNYEVLDIAVLQIKHVPGAVCELGTRRGGSLKVIVDSLLNNEDFQRNVVCVDPYGNIDYQLGETEGARPLKLDYTNDMRNESMAAIYEYAQEKPVNIVFMCMEDVEFFARYGEGVPFYNEVKTIENQYALVFYDGPHTLEALNVEIDFFNPRSPIGAVWVFDDITLYPHAQIEEKIFAMGWELLETSPRKSSYVKK